MHRASYSNVFHIVGSARVAISLSQGHLSFRRAVGAVVWDGPKVREMHEILPARLNLAVHVHAFLPETQQ
jgi:hypothetical protein